jgi:hypothetical protein
MHTSLNSSSHAKAFFFVDVAAACAGRAPESICSGWREDVGDSVIPCGCAIPGAQDGSAGDPAGPGLISTDTTDPLRVNFHCSDNGFGGRWSPTVNVNPNPPD